MAVNEHNGKTIELRLCVPDLEEVRIMCDSVRFSIPDGAGGKKSGGLVGIRRGHTDALMAVAEGTVFAFSGGRQIFSCAVGEGLAVVTGESVTILTDGGRCAKDEKEDN